jgi:uncharacterized protein (TIGR03086 family)
MTTTPRDLYLRALDSFAVILNNVSAHQWESPTPCTAWNVRQLIGHTIDAQRQLVAMLTDSPPRPPVAAATELESVASLEPKTSWRTADVDVRNAIAELNDSHEVSTPMGSKALIEVLATAVIEPFIHGWDLAIATGQQVDLDTETVDLLLPGVEALGDQLQLTGMYGPPTPAAGARPSEQLLALLGRQP